MKKVFVAIGVFFLSLSGTVYAQSWQLSGFAKESRSYISQNPNDPMFKQTIVEKTVIVAVANENGTAVAGLKTTNFLGFVESCDEFECRFIDMRVVSFPVNPNFEEQQPGLYTITFRVNGGVNLRSVFIKVLRSLTRAEIIASKGALPNRQKAQTIFR